MPASTGAPGVARVLRDIGQVLVDIHGQSEHLSLLRGVKEHINLLDRYADLWDKRVEFGKVVAQLREIRRELRRCSRTSARWRRRVDLLQFQIEEIGSAKLKPGEDATLEQERLRLAKRRAGSPRWRRGITVAYEGTEANAGRARRLGAGGQGARRFVQD